MSKESSQLKTRHMLLMLIFTEAFILAIMFSKNLSHLPEYLGLTAGKQGTNLAWILAAIITVVYVWSATSIEDVRRYLFRPDFLKMLAIIAAFMAGIIEEVVFRKLVMDALAYRGYGYTIQIAISALSFGVVHIIWGLKNISAGINAVLSTSILGAALAVVYLVGERSLAPCVVAHIIISGLIEPGLMLAAVSGRIGVWR